MANPPIWTENITEQRAAKSRRKRKRQSPMITVGPPSTEDYHDIDSTAIDSAIHQLEALDPVAIREKQKVEMQQLIGPRRKYVRKNQKENSISHSKKK